MSSEAPSTRYYRACEGQWASAIRVTVSDGEALSRSSLSAVDRAAIRLAAAWPSWLGEPRMVTSVRFTEAGEVEHTTEVRWLGLTVNRSVEVFTLDPDGVRVSIRGGMSGTAVVSRGADSVEYTLQWRGREVRQTTHLEGDTVRVRQHGEGYHVDETLRRTSN
jgi:hypothetical protein